MHIADWFRRKRPGIEFEQYIALGDSISTDDYPGEGRGAASIFFRTLQPHCPGLHFQNLALDGATSADVLHHQLLQLPGKKHGPSIITLTAGGNDILTLESEAEEIIRRLTIIVRHLTQHNDDRLILGTIYDPTDGVGDLFVGQPPLSRELQTLALVNAAIRSMENPPLVVVADIYTHFLGHGTHCKDPENPHYHPEDPTLWYLMNIEPNVRGAREIAHLFAQAAGLSGMTKY